MRYEVCVGCDQDFALRGEIYCLDCCREAEAQSEAEKQPGFSESQYHGEPLETLFS
jgi:hypothetical protein